LGRELRLAARRPADALGGLLFFVLVGSLFRWRWGRTPTLLQQIAPGVMWVAALLAVLWASTGCSKATGRWFAGAVVAGAGAAALLVLVKVAAHWLLGVPLVAGGAAAGLAVRLDGAVIAVLLASLALGTPSLYLLAASGRCTDLGLRGQLLLVLVVLPLSVPS
jgi:heme exporter protein B